MFFKNQGHKEFLQ